MKFTSDSSRYFYESDYQKRFLSKGILTNFPRSLSEWLILQGFTGKDGQNVPEMDDKIVHQISERYIELLKNYTEKTFIKMDSKILDRELKTIF